MKIWILHDTKFGNGKNLAEQLAKTYSDGDVVKIGHVKEINPKIVINDKPDVLILGGAVRMFRGAPASKKFLKKLTKIARKTNQTIPGGIVFLTHGLPTDKVQGFARRYWNKMSRSPAIVRTYPQWITAKVVGQEGPFDEGEVEKVIKQVKTFQSWMN
ncbi:MAG: hypothetical protein ACTSWC_05290 [Promethearchaeota archaeon]